MRSVSTEDTVAGTSWPLEDETDAGVLDLWKELLLDVFPISLPPLGILNNNLCLTNPLPT